MKVLFKILGIILVVIVIIAAAGLIYFNSTYPKVSPARNIKVQYTSEKIERGRYLANHVTVCIDCHSKRDWNYYSGPIIPGTEGKGGDNYGEEQGLPGRVYMKNITPATLKDWTDGEIARAITSGVNKDGKTLFPVMPYTTYRNLSEDDLYAIIAYIRTLKPIENNVPNSEINFPVNMIVKTLPKDYVPQKSPDKSDVVKYGKYLVNIIGCVDCHTKSNKGEMVKDMEFAGGNEFNFPSGIVRSANITPDKETGIGNWTKESFISRFKSFADKSNIIRINVNTEFNTPMPWSLFSGMTEEDLGAIYSYLMTIKPINNKAERFTVKRNTNVSLN
jgi:mono/diheme cytochrome c family protein